MRMIRIRKACLAGGVAILLPMCTISSQNEKVNRLDTVIVQAKRYSVHDAAMPAQILSAKDMQQRGATNAADALKHMSGVTVKDYGGIGGIKTVAIRGMGAQHTAVFYDGVAVGDCQSGQVDLGRFSTDNLNMLQFTIGQGDDIYIPARMSAAAGVVSMETRMPETNMFNISARVASFETYQANANIARCLSDDCKVSLFADYTSARGDYKFDIRNAHKGISGRRINSDVEHVRAEANVNLNIDNKHTLSAKMYGSFSERGVPGAIIVDNPLSSERLRSSNIFAQMFYEYIPSSVLRMKFTFKHNYAYDRYTQPLLGNEHSIDSYKQHETDLSATFNWRPEALPGFSFAWSEEVFHNRLNTTNSHTVMSSVPRRVTLLSAASMRYSSRYVTAVASLLGSNAWEWASKGDVAPSRHRLSPSLSLAFYPFAGNLTLRASYKDIFRMPTFNDLYYRETGNYLLSPEKCKMLNLGTVYSLSGKGVLRDFYIAIDGYMGRVEDKIVAVPGIFVWKMNNVDDVSLSGVDANMMAEFVVDATRNIDVSASYSYMRAVDDTEGSAVKGQQIVYTPLHSGALSLSFAGRIIDAGYSLVWSAERYRLPQNIPSNRVDGYCDHSLWLSHSRIFDTLHLTAKVEFMNIANKNYEIIRYYPMPGRSFRISLHIGL